MTAPHPTHRLARGHCTTDRLRLCDLGQADLERVVTLHAHLHATSPGADLFVRETDTFFARHLGPQGITLGLETPDGMLVCYAVLGLPDASSPAHFGHALAQTPQDRARTCHLDGTGVHPDWRGLGLQRHLIRARLARAQATGRTIALSTAALHNAQSLANLTAAGLRVVALVEKYDSLRLILRWDQIQPTATPQPRPLMVLLDGRPDGHRRALAQGRAGRAVCWTQAGPCLEYHSPLTGPPA